MEWNEVFNLLEKAIKEYKETKDTSIADKVLAQATEEEIEYAINKYCKLWKKKYFYYWVKQYRQMWVDIKKGN